MESGSQGKLYGVDVDRHDQMPKSRSRAGVFGAAAGVGAVALFAIAAVITGTPPDFDAPDRSVASYFVEQQTRIQVGGAFAAAAMPFLVWFLATVVSLARREHDEGADHAATFGF